MLRWSMWSSRERGAMLAAATAAVLGVLLLAGAGPLARTAPASGSASGVEPLPPPTRSSSTSVADLVVSVSVAPDPPGIKEFTVQPPTTGAGRRRAARPGRRRPGHAGQDRARGLLRHRPARGSRSGADQRGDQPGRTADHRAAALVRRPAAARSDRAERSRGQPARR